MKRRSFLKNAVIVGAAGAATAALPAPAISQGLRQWRMVTTWPKNFPGLGTGAELLAKFIERGSEGRLKIEVFGAGQLVKPFDSFDAVASGEVEMGHGTPYYWRKKIPAMVFMSAYPYGMTAQEQNGWIQYGGGQQLADQMYSELGCKYFVSGNTGVQMGGWFNKEINSLADYRGLKMRIPGIGGEVIQAAGAETVNLPGSEILGALEQGTIDATEWVGPYNDLALGVYRRAKYYYYPGWHEPGTTLDNFINQREWDKLPSDLKTVVEASNIAVNQLVLSEFVARNNGALKTLMSKHGVVLKQFPADVLAGFSTLSSQIINDLAARDSLSRRVLENIVEYRKAAVAWTSLSETTYTAARFLYSYNR